MGELRSFEDIVAFRARVETHLAADEPRNNLLFGIMHAIAAGRFAEASLWTLERGGALAAVALRTPPYNLVLSHTDAATASSFADALGAAGAEIPGVSGTEPGVSAFANRWTEGTGAAVEVQLATRIYRLSRVSPPENVPGAPRWATEDDLDLLAAWMEAFEAEIGGTPSPGSGEDRARWYLGDADSGLLVWETDGEVVSLAGHSGPTPNGMRVGPVYTPPDRRGDGFGTAVTAELSARLLASGRRFCFLFTDQANPTSNAIYQRIGYEPICDAGQLRFI